jgi:hypothetical protein
MSQSGLESGDQSLCAPPEGWMGLPANVFAKETHRIRPTLSAEVPKRGETPQGLGAEQVPAAALHLQAPEQ